MALNIKSSKNPKKIQKIADDQEYKSTKDLVIELREERGICIEQDCFIEII